MHICFICDEYPPSPHGGIGTFTKTLARGLAQKGHRVTVVGVYRIPQMTTELDNGVKVIKLPHSRVRGTGFLINGIRLRRELRKIHAENAIDVIEGPESSLALLGTNPRVHRIIRMNGGHHFFYSSLGLHPRLWRSWLERMSFSRADELCAVSHFVAEMTRTCLGLRDRHIEILPNPIDTELFRPLNGIPTTNGLIAFVGTIREKKGVKELILAFPHIVRAVPYARMMLLGPDWTDPDTGESYTAFLKTLVSTELIDRIDFKGKVPHDDLPAILAQAEVLVYPSHMEAMGIVIAEGMAMGKPVVANLTGPGPEIIEDGTSGLLCNPHNPEDISEKVIRILADPRLQLELGKSARVRAVSLYSIDHLLARNEEFYMRCLRTKS